MTEYIELTKKLIKLERFINTPEFEDLPIRQVVMAEYERILKDRHQLILGGSK